jgi:hypothetical protein
MIIRDINGKLNIISKKTSKNNISYYNKIYNIKLEYLNKYNNGLKVNCKTNSQLILEELT